MDTKPEYPHFYDSDRTDAELRTAVQNGAVPVAVYGLGKMGLPLAAVFADRTGNTTGVDIDPDVVDAVNRGYCPVDGEPGLASCVETTVESGALTATADPVLAAREARVHVVIVPTLVEDGSPDMSQLLAAVESIGEGLTPGDLVCIESTVPPGTCEEVVLPTLTETSGLDPEQFGVAFCPERTSSGRALEDIRGSYPKVVGGVDAPSGRAAAVLYSCITDNEVTPVSDARTAECVKVFEGVYRDVNIALANELARSAGELSIDVREAIDVANGQPYCDIHDPGPGVGGHCIPYYPYFLIDTLDTETPLLETARAVNDSMPAFTVETLRTELQRRGTDLPEATIAVLGVAYRPGVNETCESPGLEIVELLDDAGANVVVVDPDVTLDLPGIDQVSVEEIGDIDFDGVILTIDHDAFGKLGSTEFGGTVVVDGRDALADDTGQNASDTDENGDMEKGAAYSLVTIGNGATHD